MQTRHIYFFKTEFWERKARECFALHYLKNNKSSVFYYIFPCFIPIFRVINVTLPQI